MRSDLAPSQRIWATSLALIIRNVQMSKIEIRNKQSKLSVSPCFRCSLLRVFEIRQELSQDFLSHMRHNNNVREFFGSILEIDVHGRK